MFRQALPGSKCHNSPSVTTANPGLLLHNRPERTVPVHQQHIQAIRRLPQQFVLPDIPGQHELPRTGNGYRNPQRQAQIPFTHLNPAVISNDLILSERRIILADKSIETRLPRAFPRPLPCPLHHRMLQRLVKRNQVTQPGLPYPLRFGLRIRTSFLGTCPADTRHPQALIKDIIPDFPCRHDTGDN